MNDLLNYVLNKKFSVPNNTKSQIKKHKPNGEIEFRPVYFNSTTKTVINHKFSMKNDFQNILYKIDD